MQPPQSPIVSVVMPVYNSRRYIEAAVHSILAQTLSDFELIIVDDGSSDGTADILRRLARRDCRIRLIQQRNTGVCGASNRGIAEARGEFFARMDHDDIALPDRLERQVEYLRAYPEIVAVGAQVLMIDSDGLPIRIASAPLTHEKIEEMFALDWPMFHPTLMARMDVMRKLGGYREQYNSMEDLDLFIRLAEYGRLANLPQVLLKYRQHITSICYSRARDQLMQMQSIFREAAQRRGKMITTRYEDLDDALRKVEPLRHRQWAYEKMWAWWALTAGYVTTARRHAMRALKLGPLRYETWLLLWCAMRGR